VDFVCQEHILLFDRKRYAPGSTFMQFEFSRQSSKYMYILGLGQFSRLPCLSFVHFFELVICLVKMDTFSWQHWPLAKLRVNKVAVLFSSVFILLLIRPTVPCWSANRLLSPKLWGHRVWCYSHDWSWSTWETIIHGILSRRFNHSIQKRWAIQIWRYCWYVKVYNCAGFDDGSLNCPIRMMSSHIAPASEVAGGHTITF
jgi:hypothetical protein